MTSLNTALTPGKTKIKLFQVDQLGVRVATLTSSSLFLDAYILVLGEMVLYIGH